MANKIQLRRDTSINWANVNPILTDGEPGLEVDTNRIKYGDGISPWSSLSYGGTANITFTGTTLNGPTCVAYNAGPTHGNIQVVPNAYQCYVNHGQYLNIYPTIGTDNPHIHIAAGSGSCGSGDLILGDDNKNVSIVNDGNVQINSYSGSTQHRWTFDNTGNLELPTGGKITQVYGETTLLDPNGVAIAAGIGHAIAVNSGIGVGLYSNNHTWLFNTCGNLILPPTNQLTVAPTSETGVIVEGIEYYLGEGASYTYVWNNAINPNFVILYNYGPSIVGWTFYPTGNIGEAVTITSYAPLGPWSLGFSGPLLGGVTTYTAQSPDYMPAHNNSINVTTNNYTWVFNKNGQLCIPQGGYVGGFCGEGTFIVAGPGSYAGISSASGNAYVCAGEDYITIGTNYFGTPQCWSFSSNGILTLPVGGQISSAAGIGNVVIQSNDGSNAYDWTFGNNGNLTLPANGTVSYTPATPSNWNSPAPTTIEDALDRLAAVVKVLNGGTGA